MNDQFFKAPILNSPYEQPVKHWELDETGQPTQKIINSRRRAEFITPIPKPKKRKGAAQQESLTFDEGKRLSTQDQQYDHTAVIGGVRRQVDRWRQLPDPSQWQVTPETARLLQHWRHHSLMDAIECGIVKLPRVPVADILIKRDEMPMFRKLWDHIAKEMPKKGRGKGGKLNPFSLPSQLVTALEALYGHYKATYELWEQANIGVPPYFIVVCPQSWFTTISPALPEQTRMALLPSKMGRATVIHLISLSKSKAIAAKMPK